jgi:transcriptional regulator with XRE-family HTH domain
VSFASKMEKVREIDPRRAELGEFLRSRRAALTPEAVGLRTGPRRRTPGLRREEVAELAEISVALYTWLEQGRDVPVSRRTIDAVATALQLGSGEHRHMHYLAMQEEVALREEITPRLRQLVRSFRRFPVFVLDHVWDIVLKNDAADVVFDIEAYGPTGDGRPNMLKEVFLRGDSETFFIDHRLVAESLLAMFRLDFPAHADDPRSVEIVSLLRRESPLFNELWQRYTVREAPEGSRRLNHPRAGLLSLEPSLLGVVESPGLRMMLYTPSDAETTARIERLLEEHDATKTASIGPAA